MKKSIALPILLVTAAVASPYKYDSPWLTGPIIAAPGHVLKPGDVNWQFYLWATDDSGDYNNTWHRIKTPRSQRTKSAGPLTIFGIGLWANWDLHISWPFLVKFRDGQRTVRSGDTSVELGWQVLHDTGSFTPDIRFTLSEQFPSGQYQKLLASKLGTDIGGGGAYVTDVGIKFQKLWRTFGQQFLSMRLNFDYQIPTHVNVQGINTYGGVGDTNAKVKPGQTFVGVISAEQTLVRRWALAIDFMYTHTQRTTFTGNAGTGGSLASNSASEYSLAPAIEYNPNGSLGFIAGVWFSFAGKNSEDFTTFALSCTFGY